jgi:NADH dehydrogenase FAD-containing subunit
MTYTILIVGASYAGLQVAHTLLKNSISARSDLKVILVSASTHHYLNIASVRAIIPGKFRDDQLFAPIAEGFAKYPAEHFELVVGTAEDADVEKKTVHVGSRAIAYDILVVTTGSRTSEDGPWKGIGSYEKTLAHLKEYQAKVKDANSIIIVGGGPTGVETAGELADAGKDVTLVCCRRLVTTIYTDITIDYQRRNRSGWCIPTKVG